MLQICSIYSLVVCCLFLAVKFSCLFTAVAVLASLRSLITFWARLALGTVPSLALSFCCAGLKIGNGPSTGAILTAHTDFFHGTARLSVYTCVKVGTANRGVPFTLSEFACCAEKQRHPYYNISRAVPKTL